ncbi:unnamed protein product, partial [Symbiodinium sp. CCMP2456]
MERCRKVHMIPPDPSVLARGLMGPTDRHISSSTDASFRTAMLRTTLRLDARPTVDQVLSYQKHLQAEVEVLIAAQVNGAAPLQPKLRAVDTGLSPKARDTAGKGQLPDLCRYFAKASGCKRGEKCSYSHSMAGMDKDVRARKCLKCGSESHRQKECPVGRPGAKSNPAGPPKDGGATKQGSTTSPPATLSTMSTLDSTRTSTLQNDNAVQGTPWMLETLTQIFESAQQVLLPQPWWIAGLRIASEPQVHLMPYQGPLARDHQRDEMKAQTIDGERVQLQVDGGCPQLRELVMNSKRWIVHLYAGTTGHWEIMKLDQGETSVIELDVNRCAGHDVMRDETWRMLLWGAKHGKIDVILGGPPGRTKQKCTGGQRDVKSLTLVTRMMFLYMMAEVGREINGCGANKDRDVGFMLEYPEGTQQAERDRRAMEIRQFEE